MVSNIMAFIANPSGQFSIFGFSPRSILFMLALLVFAWRWCGWWRASYLLTLLLAFIHQSMAALLLTTVLCIDVVIRPRTLVRADVLPWALLAGGVFAWRESLWRYILPGEEARSLWLALAGMVVLSVAVAVLFLTRSRLRTWRRGLSLRLSVLPTCVSDSVLLFVGWLITLPIGYLLARHVGLLEGTYFWYQIHARLLALYQPVIMFGVATWLLMRYRLLAGNRQLVVVALVTVSIALLAMYAARTSVDSEPFLSGMEHLALRTEYSIQGPPTFDNEAVIYMAMARTLDTGTDYLARIFPELGTQQGTP
jgi:hypothetical protein